MKLQYVTTTDGEVIDVSRLLTIADYAKRHVCIDGTIGCHQSYVKTLMLQGKLPYIEVAGKSFVVLPATSDAPPKKFAVSLSMTLEEFEALHKKNIDLRTPVTIDGDILAKAIEKITEEHRKHLAHVVDNAKVAIGDVPIPCEEWEHCIKHMNQNPESE